MEGVVWVFFDDLRAQNVFFGVFGRERRLRGPLNSFSEFGKIFWQWQGREGYFKICVGAKHVI